METYGQSCVSAKVVSSAFVCGNLEPLSVCVAMDADVVYLSFEYFNVDQDEEVA